MDAGRLSPLSRCGVRVGQRRPPRGSRVAEFAGRLWFGADPAIGAWNPPTRHPVRPAAAGETEDRDRDRGARTPSLFPATDFSRSPGPERQIIWALPMSWFARGRRGSLAADRSRRQGDSSSSTRSIALEGALEFHDAIADVALHRTDEDLRVLLRRKLFHRGTNGSTVRLTNLGGTLPIRWTRGRRCRHRGHVDRAKCFEWTRRKVEWRVTLRATERRRKHR